MMADLPRLFHTVRYLRWEQVVFRLTSKVRKIRVRVKTGPSVRPGFPVFGNAAFREAGYRSDHGFDFLGEAHSVDLTTWETGEPVSLLWLYNLHYFDDLCAVDADGRAQELANLVESWIAAEFPLGHAALAPYPTSLRLVNWIKWLSRHPDESTPRIRLSIAKQADVLEQRIEYHLLGNHLFENARALVFSGAFLDGEDAGRWLLKGVRILDRELKEQFLLDGGHFERSPMYQGAMLWGLLDLVELAAAMELPLLCSRLGSWRKCFERGMLWLEKMTFPDGDIAFFNDAAFGIAPNFQSLVKRAAQLGIPFDRPEPETANALSQMFDLADSGYVRVEWGQATMIADAAPLGPDYLPGHGHADTLSFELCLGNERMFVNSGTSCYGTGQERDRQRGTAAHNTVVVNGENSSDVWAGFRVGRRAYPIDRKCVETRQGFEISCAHTGYEHLSTSVRHQRRWLCESAELTIEDRLSGQFSSATGHLHLHPNWQVLQKSSQECLLQSKGGLKASLKVEGGRFAVEEATWHPHFGESVPSLCIVTNFDQAVVTHRITW